MKKIILVIVALFSLSSVADAQYGRRANRQRERVVVRQKAQKVVVRQQVQKVVVRPQVVRQKVIVQRQFVKQRFVQPICVEEIVDHCAEPVIFQDQFISPIVSPILSIGVPRPRLFIGGGRRFSIRVR